MRWLVITVQLSETIIPELFSGGEDFRVYQWMMKHGGIPSEESYGPYLGADGYCHAENMTLVASIKGYVNVTSGDIDAMKVALFQHGPLSVAIDAAHKSFSFYANGVYYEPECGWFLFCSTFSMYSYSILRNFTKETTRTAQTMLYWLWGMEFLKENRTGWSKILGRPIGATMDT